MCINSKNSIHTVDIPTRAVIDICQDIDGLFLSASVTEHDTRNRRVDPGAVYLDLRIMIESANMPSNIK